VANIDEADIAFADVLRHGTTMDLGNAFQLMKNGPQGWCKV
jgi:hypothetical protein